MGVASVTLIPGVGAGAGVDVFGKENGHFGAADDVVSGDIGVRTDGVSGLDVMAGESGRGVPGGVLLIMKPYWTWSDSSMTGLIL